MKAMTDPRREIIKELDKQRHTKRSALSGDVAQAKHNLHPRTLAQRWKDKKRLQLLALSDSGKQNLAKNAPLIGLAGAAILLFSVRKPISNIIQNLRNTARQPKDDKP